MITFGSAFILLAGAFFELGFQLYFYGKIPILGIVLFGILGFICLVSGSFLGIMGLMSNRNLRNKTIKKLHNIKIMIGTIEKDAVTIFYDNHELLISGIAESPYREQGNSQPLYQIISKLDILKLVELKPRHVAEGWEEMFWRLTDKGRDIITHLEGDKLNDTAKS